MMSVMILVSIFSSILSMEECDSGGFYSRGDLCLLGCSDCIDNTTCQTCAPGFVITDEQVCSRCGITGCERCLLETIDSVCSQCFDEYVPFGTEICLSCTASIGGSTGWDENADGCSVVDATSVLVDSCVDGYGTWEDASGTVTCVECPGNSSCQFTTGGETPVISSMTCNSQFTEDAEVENLCLSCETATGGDPMAYSCTSSVSGEVIVQVCDMGPTISYGTYGSDPVTCKPCGEGSQTCSFTGEDQTSTTCYYQNYAPDSADPNICLSCTDATDGDPEATKCDTGTNPGEVVVTVCGPGHGKVPAATPYCYPCIDGNASRCTFDAVETELSTICKQYYTNDAVTSTKCLNCRETSPENGGDPNAWLCSPGSGAGEVEVDDCDDTFEYYTDGPKPSCVDCKTDDPYAEYCDVDEGGNVLETTGCIGGWEFDDVSKHCYQCATLPDPDPDPDPDPVPFEDGGGVVRIVGFLLVFLF